MKQQKIARNPTEGAITVAQKQRRMQPPAGPDLARFLGAVAESDPALAAFVAIAAGTG